MLTAEEGIALLCDTLGVERRASDANHAWQPLAHRMIKTLERAGLPVRVERKGEGWCMSWDGGAVDSSRFAEGVFNAALAVLLKEGRIKL